MQRSGRLLQNMHQANTPLRDQSLPAVRRADRRSASVELFQVPRSISRKRSAAGARRPPRRRTTPSCVTLPDSDRSRDDDGMISLGCCELRQDRDAEPSLHETQGCRQVGHLIGPTQAYTGSHERGIQHDAVAAGPAHGHKRLALEIRPRDSVPLGQRVVPSASQDKGILDQGLERQLRIRCPKKIDAELDFATSNALEDLRSRTGPGS